MKLCTYELLRNMFKDFVVSNGIVTFEEMIYWAKRHNIGLITLSIIVNDLLTDKELIPAGKFVKIDEEELALPIPEYITIPLGKEGGYVVTSLKLQRCPKCKGLIRVSIRGSIITVECRSCGEVHSIRFPSVNYP